MLTFKSYLNESVVFSQHPTTTNNEMYDINFGINLKYYANDNTNKDVFRIFATVIDIAESDWNISFH